MSYKDTQPMDAHLEILMQWLKDNDEAAIKPKVDPNYAIPDMVDGTADTYDY